MYPTNLMSTPLTNSRRLGTILSIWAHPDDETYLAGGLMADAAARGQRVVCVTASAGELGTPDPERWPPERLGQVRAWEAVAAMAVLGVSEHRLLGLPDGSLAEHDEAGTVAVARIIDEVRPDTVLTFGPDGITYHPDHIAVHRWVTRAWYRAGCRPRLLYAASTVAHLAQFAAMYEEWGVYVSERRPAGVPAERLAVHVELDGTALERKLTALRAMSTQTARVVANLDPDVYAAEVAEEAFVEAAPLVAPHRAAPHVPVHMPVLTGR
jgi:LmbE family N-acetylglucosaminyl deacetylase